MDSIAAALLSSFYSSSSQMAVSSLHPSHCNYKNFLPSIRRRSFNISCCLALNPSNEHLSTSSNRLDDIRIVFAAGGTGGHIYPAIAIADNLKIICPTTKILFVGTQSGMEAISVKSAGYDFVSIPAVSLIRPLLSPLNLLFPFRLLLSVAASYRKLRDFNSSIVVGTGGYVSAPMCLAAALGGVKVVIQEQNYIPGLANRLLATFAHKVFVAFESCSMYFPKDKCVVSGNPVRVSLKRYISKAVARLHFFPMESVAGGAHVVLVLGGSLGANGINIAVLNMYCQMLLKHENRFIIWQTGVEGFDEMESLVRNHPRLLLTPFLHSMDLAYAAADLVVSRAGAMTCSEILAIGKPSLLIPSPNVAEGHQVKNASMMASIAGSRILLEDELDSTTLGNAIDEILGNDREMTLMCEKALKAARPDASSQIAEFILSIVKLPAQHETNKKS